jgi:hypothetical protein
MSTHDGGPAFPTSNGGSPDDGMTLRDYFAGKAMQTILAKWPPRMGTESEIDADLSEIAAGAYLLADAMLRAMVKP